MEEKEEDDLDPWSYSAIGEEGQSNGLRVLSRFGDDDCADMSTLSGT